MRRRLQALPLVHHLAVRLTDLQARQYPRRLEGAQVFQQVVHQLLAWRLLELKPFVLGMPPREAALVVLVQVRLHVAVPHLVALAVLLVASVQLVVQVLPVASALLAAPAVHRPLLVHRWASQELQSLQTVERSVFSLRAASFF